MEEEGVEHLRAAFSMAEKQLIYGVPNDPAGYTGLADNPELASKAKETVVDAGFSASPDCTSVYCCARTTATSRSSLAITPLALCWRSNRDSSS